MKWSTCTLGMTLLLIVLLGRGMGAQPTPATQPAAETIPLVPPPKRDLPPPSGSRRAWRPTWSSRN